MMHLSADDLSAAEVVQAFVLVQQDRAPEDIIHALRGKEAQLLDPDQFPREVQRRQQELDAQSKPRRNEADDEE
ncbi:MAG: hypothetical protein Q7S29_02855 [Candidatus Peribacter sp.]|nr:hypothetical protein [Candidatus Peribacter sp.]